MTQVLLLLYRSSHDTRGFMPQAPHTHDTHTHTPAHTMTRHNTAAEWYSSKKYTLGGLGRARWLSVLFAERIFQEISVEIWLLVWPAETWIYDIQQYMITPQRELAGCCCCCLLLSPGIFGCAFAFWLILIRRFRNTGLLLYMICTYRITLNWLIGTACLLWIPAVCLSTTTYQLLVLSYTHK